MNIRNDNFDKAEEACQAFGCVPYFAIVIDAGAKIYAFILSMEELLRLFPKGQKVSVWRMTPRSIASYRDNPNIVMLELTHNIHQWFGNVSSSPIMQLVELTDEAE